MLFILNFIVKNVSIWLTSCSQIPYETGFLEAYDCSLGQGVLDLERIEQKRLHDNLLCEKESKECDGLENL